MALSLMNSPSYVRSYPSVQDSSVVFLYVSFFPNPDRWTVFVLVQEQAASTTMSPTSSKHSSPLRNFFSGHSWRVFSISTERASKLGKHQQFWNPSVSSSESFYSLSSDSSTLVHELKPPRAPRDDDDQAVDFTKPSTLPRTFTNPRFSLKPRARPSTAINITTTVLKLAKGPLGAIPIPGVDAVRETLVTILESYQSAYDNEEKTERLAGSIDSFLAVLEEPTLGEVNGGLQTRISEIHWSLQERLTELEKLHERSRFKAVFLTNVVSEKLDSLKTFLDDTVRNFNTYTQTSTAGMVVSMYNSNALSTLRVAEAGFQSISKDECVGNTYSQLRTTITSHLSSATSRFIFLKGSPGTSKTAISKSIALELSQQKRLAASFFFDKSGNGKGTNSIEMFVGTLASQLAEFNAEYQARLVKALADNPGILRRTREQQLDKLVLEPFVGVTSLETELPAVIVLDGLDECGSSSDLKELMNLVLALDKLPSNIVTLVSCRPEPVVMRSWKVYGKDVPTFDTNSNPSDTQTAMEGYVREKFDAIIVESESDIGVDNEEEAWRPDEEEIQEFVKQCNGLFQVLSMRVHKVEDLALGNSTFRDAFREVMEEARRMPAATYESEYLAVLRRAYLGERRSESRLIAFRKVMAVIVGAKEALGVRAVCVLLGMEEAAVRALLKPLSSVISVGRGKDESSDDGRRSDDIRISHATFKEFLTGAPAGDDEEKRWFFFKDDMVQSFLACCCLRYLDSVLGSTRPTSDILSTLLPIMQQTRDSLTASSDPNASPSSSALQLSLTEIAQARALEYACLHWGTHFHPETAWPETWDALRTFMLRNVLRWLELMAEMDKFECDPDMPQLCISLNILDFLAREHTERPFPEGNARVGELASTFRNVLDAISQYPTQPWTQNPSTIYDTFILSLSPPGRSLIGPLYKDRGISETALRSCLVTSNSTTHPSSNISANP